MAQSRLDLEIARRRFIRRLLSSFCRSATWSRRSARAQAGVMVRTEDLIDRLGRHVIPIGRRALAVRLIQGFVAGAAAAACFSLCAQGVIGDLERPARGVALWIKLAYGVSIAAAALYLASRLARPYQPRLGRAWMLMVPVTVLALVSAMQLARLPERDWVPLVLGHSWRICPLVVLILSLPVFLGLCWSFRKFAPTRLRAAGAVAGLAAGGTAASLYGLHCSEVSPAFVLTWYTLGITLAAIAGALIGPRLLRW